MIIIDILAFFPWFLFIYLNQEILSFDVIKIFWILNWIKVFKVKLILN
jgi:hypothetical protein